MGPFFSPPLVMMSQTPTTLSLAPNNLSSPIRDRSFLMQQSMSSPNNNISSSLALREDSVSVGDLFPHMRTSVNNVKSKLQAMVQASKSSFDALLSTKNDKDELRYQCDVLKVPI